MVGYPLPRVKSAIGLERNGFKVNPEPEEDPDRMKETSEGRP
jgi:hypothetical protein